MSVDSIVAIGVGAFTAFAALSSFPTLTIAIAAFCTSAVTAIFARSACFGALVAFGYAFSAFTAIISFSTTTATATASTPAIAVAVAAFIALAIFRCAFATFAHIGGWLFLGFCCAANQALEPTKETTCAFSFRSRLTGLSWGWLCRFRLWQRSWRRSIRQHPLDNRCLTVCGLLRATRHSGGIFHHFSHGVAGFYVVQARVVVLQTLELVVRCFQRLVGNQQHIDALFQFNLGNFWTLFV